MFLRLGLFFFFAISLSASAQQAVYIEPAGGGYFEFHFNEQYFLVDKDCEFKTIVRVSRLNANKRFDGAFTDYSPDGQTLLTGVYNDGKKSGTFKAYYPNGFLKWQGDYADNEPQGVWNFYYSNGKPRTILEFRNTRAYLLESWDDKGKHMVKAGRGKFELKDPVFGYNDTGHEAFVYSGKVRDGVPNGVWLIRYAFPDGQAEQYALQQYNNGVTGSAVAIRYSETEEFENAEKLVGKPCTIDDHINFTKFLQDFFNLKFDFDKLEPNVTALQIEAELTVDTEGQASKVQLKSGPGHAAEKELIKLLKSVSYWVPSQKGGAVIEDVLKLKVGLTRNDSDVLVFGLPVIERTTGS